VLSATQHRRLLAAIGVSASLVWLAFPASAGAGARDTTFGSGGSVSYAPGSTARGLLQPDGKFLVVSTRGHSIAFTRFWPAGPFDGSYGSGGRREVAVKSDWLEFLGATLDGRGRAVALATQGQLNTGDYTPMKVVLIRLSSSGEPDATFDGDGVVKLPIAAGFQPYAMSEQVVGSQRKLVLVGDANGVMTAMRLDESGGIDPTFGIGGSSVVATAPGSARSVKIQPDGKILMSGPTTLSHTTDGGFGFARLQPNGLLDRSFGDNGVVEVAATGCLSHYRHTTDAVGPQIALTPGGKVVGVSAVECVRRVRGERAYTKPRRFLVARLTARGFLDTTFNGTGFAVADFGPPPPAAYFFGGNTPTSVVAQPDGKVVVAGELHNANYWGGGLARFTAGGQLDPTFGTGGRVLDGPSISTLHWQGGKLLAIGAGRAVRFTA
jgi:uncharacterized delta-60 repeat protein